MALSKRTIIMVSLLLILIAFFSLFGWGLARSGGVTQGLGINKVFGELNIEKSPAPDFTLELLDGQSLTLSDLKGKVVLIDFWASWCPPCRQEAPGMVQVYNEYRDRGVEFIGISIWNRLSDAKEYTDNFGISYPSGLDEQGTILVNYGVRGIPEKFFINGDGQQVARFIGPSDVESLRETLDLILADQY